MTTTDVLKPRMFDPAEAIERAFRAAIASVLGDGFGDVDPQIRPAQNPAFGDYQVNAAMSLAKQAGAKPRDLAARLASVAASHLSAVAEPPEVAGPGFINVRLKPDLLGEMLAIMHGHDLGIEPRTETHSIVIDMCSVNVAKQMHVGHLRSTIIGGALSNVYERLGRVVHRQNHLGDWGLQIGMVLHQLRDARIDLDDLNIEQLETAYRDAQLVCRADHAGLDAARRFGAGPHRIVELENQNAGAEELLLAVKQTLVRLQQGQAEYVRDWKKLIQVTMRAVYEVIDLLNVRLGPESERGESYYREQLQDVVQSFREAGLARADDGAIVVPFENRERPLLIQKSDGGYLYATTDLAAIRFRARELNAERIIYIVDARQRDHFRDVFDAARMIGWHRTLDGREAELIHIPFGTVLGEDRKPLKTRAGENVTLRALLNEAIARGTEEVRKRAADPSAPTHGLSSEEIDATGRAVGVGAVKYADLSNDLARDYVFDFERMIAFDGNTGPYIQYAHARICSILARGEVDQDVVSQAPIIIGEPAERALALLLLRYPRVVANVADSLEPHRLCAYLYDLANAYAVFYQACPVLRAERDVLRNSRLHQCLIVRDVIRDGLGLLGIEAPSRM